MKLLYIPQIDLPFHAIADFEALQDPLDGDDGRKTRRLGKHEPVAVSVQILSTDPSYVKKPALFTGAGCAEELLKYLATEAEHITESLYKKINMRLTPTDRASFAAADKCWVCGGEKEQGEKFVRDHDHITGKYRGAAHNRCNLLANIIPANYKLPVFFHNLSGYDAHLIISKASQKLYGRITCIPKTSERFISFEVGKLVFKDSANFTQASLSTLVKNLVDTGGELVHTRRLIEETLMDPENAVEKRNTPAPQPESDEEFDGEEGHSIEGEDEMNFNEQAEMMGLEQESEHSDLDDDDSPVVSNSSKRKRSKDAERKGAGGKRRKRATLIDDEAIDSDDEGAEESDRDEVENEHDREFIDDVDQDDEDDLHRRLDADRVEREMEEQREILERNEEEVPARAAVPAPPPISHVGRIIGSIAMGVREQVR